MFTSQEEDHRLWRRAKERKSERAKERRAPMIIPDVHFPGRLQIAYWNTCGEEIREKKRKEKKKKEK
jgi:hypothetical protein